MYTLHNYYIKNLQVLVKRSTLKVLEGPKVKMVEKRNFIVRYTWDVCNSAMVELKS
jgi:hypothetical protein